MADRSLLRQPLYAVAPLIERREISPVELTTLAIESIEQVNPAMNAFRVVMPERALAAAQTAEAEIVAGTYRGPLHGMPIAIKDLMDIVGETTPAGSKVLAERVATEDSEGVRLLREAGAVITGKTSMPEFAFSPASNNQHYGPVPNPWNAERDSAGSSSGSGAAVAVGLVYGATGSDTGGSIRMPASACGIVGIKPTFGRVSGRGTVSLSWSLDHIGPMTRTVLDAAIMLDALAGYDSGDARTRRVPAGGYAASVEDGVAGLRVALISDDGGGTLGTPAVLSGLATGAATLEAAGAYVEEVAVPEIADLAALYSALIAIEAAAYYEPFMRDRPEDLGDFARERMLLAYAYSPAFFVQGSQTRAALRRRIEERLAGYDLVAVPGMPHEAPPLGIVEQNTRYTGPFNALGWPAIVVPIDIGADNLPVAFQVAARPWQETHVLRAGRVVERDGPWNGRMPQVR